MAVPFNPVRKQTLGLQGCGPASLPGEGGTEFESLGL